MKYSEKQIRKAYEHWITEVRLIPSNFISDEATRKQDVKEVAKGYTKLLIEYIDEAEL